MFIAIAIAFLVGLACGAYGHKWMAAEVAKAPTVLNSAKAAVADEFKKL